ncbi:hypothetical protein RUM43_003804 [Polyplax serrata]|uniref:Uncharacterized protein n=1 Tax=Polyplax serrata TaxID=468196 RepID=A0AAN8PFJ0_POLSC
MYPPESDFFSLLEQDVVGDLRALVIVPEGMSPSFLQGSGMQIAILVTSIICKLQQKSGHFHKGERVYIQ